MKYNEEAYIVRNAPVYYSYWMIHTVGDTRIYYHGIRTEKRKCVDIRDMEVYHSSSKVVKKLYEASPASFEKRIDRILKTREELYNREIYVHERLNVAKNDKFYNLKNACPNFNGIIEGTVSAIVNGVSMQVKKEQFDILKKANLACGVMKGTCTVIDENGKNIRIPVEEAKQRNLVGNTKNHSVYYNIQTNEQKWCSFEEYETLDKSVWKNYANVMIQCRDENDKMIMVNRYSEEYKKYKKYCEGYVTVWDEQLQKYKNVKKDEAKNYITAAKHRDNKYNVTVINNKFETYTKDSRTLTDEEINLRVFKRKTIDNKVCYLHEISDVSKVKSRNVYMYDNEKDEFFVVPNTDCRFLYFERYSVTHNIRESVQYFFIDEGVMKYSKYYKENYIAKKNDDGYWEYNERKYTTNGFMQIAKGIKNENS